MKLLSLEVQGFKTFLNKTKLVFKDGISVVVGPNGSGKSNISDAIRWVLGETSIKLLRCSKMEDIIFNGSSSLKPRGFAEVSLTFENKKRELNYDSDNVSITRRYSRSGESEYIINGKQSRLKDVNELFMNTGIGRDGYSVIGQGLIDSIVSSRSEDRREIFEEAAGISKYRYRKSEAMSKLAGAEQNLIRLNDIMSGLEERVEPLAVQAQKASTYIEYSEEMKGLEIGIFSLGIKDKQSLIKKYDKDISQLYGDKECEENKLKNIEQEIEQSFINNNKFLVDTEKLRNDISNLEEEISAKEKEISILKNDIFHNKKRMEALNNNISELKNTYINNIKNLDIKNDLCKQKEAEISEYEKRLSLLNIDLQNVAKRIEEHEGKSTEILLNVSSIESKISEQKIEKSMIISLISQSETNIENTKSSINENNLSLSNFEKENTQNKLKYEELNNKSEYISKCLNEISYEIKNLEPEYISLEKEKKDITSKMEDNLRKAKILEDMERNMEGFSQSVRTIIKAAEKGKLKGIHGPVSRILSVDTKYSIAIDVALGMSAQNIVTSNESDTKTAIYYLKEQRCGRATFMPISTIKGIVLDTAPLRDAKGFLDIAKNVCKYSEEYENILNYLLGRVVIADNLDNALEIAKKFSYRFKIVTLDGQIINSGGSFTGGSISSRQGFISRDSEIKSLRHESKEYERKICSIDEELKSKKEKLNFLKDKKSKHIEESYLLRESKSEIQTRIAICDSNIDTCKKKIKELEGICSTQGEKIENFNRDIIMLDESIKRLSDELDKLKISNTGTSGEKEKLISKREEISESIQELRLKRMSYSGELKMINAESARIKEDMSTIDIRLSSDKNEIISLSEKNKEGNKKAEMLKEDIVRVRNEVEGK